MAKITTDYQPGIIFNDVFLGGLRALGSGAEEFAAKHDLKRQNLRIYSTGHSNGPRAREVRELMIREIGPDLFDALYKARAKKEGLML